jgi:hypothetical protein
VEVWGGGQGRVCAGKESKTVSRLCDECHTRQ